MRRFALKSRLDGGDPDGQGLEMIATLYVRCKPSGSLTTEKGKGGFLRARNKDKPFAE